MIVRNFIFEEKYEHPYLELVLVAIQIQQLVDETNKNNFDKNM